MQATVVGIRKVDFKDKDGRAMKGVKLFITHAEKGVEGSSVNALYIDETKGVAPSFGVGEVIDVEYNRYGKLHQPE